MESEGLAMNGKARQPPISISEASHMAFLHRVATCAATGRSSERIEVEHLRGPAFAMNKPIDGMGMKPDFIWCIPLAASEHHKRHQMGAEKYFSSIWWPMQDLERGPFAFALALVAFSGRDDVEGAQRWIAHCTLERTARRARCVR